MGFVESERARHEREAVERDERVAAKRQAEIDARETDKVAEKRAELAARINDAERVALRDTLAERQTVAARELSDCQTTLETFANDPSSSLDSLFTAYRAVLAAGAALNAVREFATQAGGGRYVVVETPDFATVAQAAATRHAVNAGRQAGFDVTHAVGAAQLDAADRVRANDQ